MGPSGIFLRYIDEVLPSLGEDDVMLATPAALKPRLRVRGEEPSPVAAVKGDARMAKVIAAAVADRERPMPRDVMVTLDGYRLRMRRRDSARIVERTRARRGNHNERRPFITGSWSTTSVASTDARSSMRTAATARVSTPDAVACAVAEVRTSTSRPRSLAG